MHCTFIFVSRISIQWNYFHKFTAGHNIRNSISFFFHPYKRPQSSKTSTILWFHLYNEVLPIDILLGIGPLNDWTTDAFSCFTWCFTTTWWEQVLEIHTRHRFNNRNGVVYVLIPWWFMVSVICKRNDWLEYHDSFYYHSKHFTSWNFRSQFFKKSVIILEKLIIRIRGF